MPSFQNDTSEISKIRVALGHDQIIKARQFQALHVFQMLKNSDIISKSHTRSRVRGLEQENGDFPHPNPLEVSPLPRSLGQKTKASYVCYWCAKKHKEKQYLSTNLIMIKSSFNRIFNYDQDCDRFQEVAC